MRDTIRVILVAIEALCTFTMIAYTKREPSCIKSIVLSISKVIQKYQEQNEIAPRMTTRTTREEHKEEAQGYN